MENRSQYANEAKYLGMTLDTRLRWKAHVKKKREELGIRYSKILLVDRKKFNTFLLQQDSHLQANPETHMDVWNPTLGLCSKSNVDIIQRFQNKVLRNIVNAPRFIRNADIHRDLKVEFVASEIGRFARKHAEKIQQHDNEEVTQLLDNTSCAG
ncbi:hypothetical protein LSTR_LSTR013199 [Laodelphax striatellus]|uniref:Uncharacterized protein n=1 Tax=Laodelphax striatellus TaxID=195883 RepID=A0A482XEJ9_LAOST|nr:hypothetical protein LSTR_LSTR013199 [Laodelphax striatellus]